VSASRARERYRLDDLVIDVGAVAVWRNGERLSVPDLSFATLACLVRRAPDVVSQDDLVAEVWQGTAVSDETIKQRITLLRRALGDDWREPRYVRSVRARGYQLVPAPERVEDTATEPSTEPPAEPPGSGWRTPIAAVLVALALAAGVLLVRRADEGGDRDVPRVEAELSADDLVARAREYFALHRESDNERAIELLGQALVARPDDAEAVALLSLARSQRAAKFNGPVSEASEGEALAERAIELAPELAEAHHALGLARDSQGRLSSALVSYRRAVELEPGHRRATGSGAYVLGVTGQLAEALRWNLSLLADGADLHYLEIQIAEILAALDYAPTAEAWYQKAVTLRPENLFAATAFAGYRMRRGDLAGAEELIEGAVAAGVERPELHELRGHLAAMKGDVEAASDFYRRALEVTPRSAASARLLALAAAEDPETHRQRVEATIETLTRGLAASNEWPPSAVEVALLSSTLGDHADAFAALDRAIDLGYRDSAWLLVDPALADLRGEARFWARIERVRALVADEREVVLRADWLPAGFLEGAG
jgi:DNA-binding winged helix-turn-helix (wHTH) protein/Flp pilus assembly protein TadD